jgi:hypothetical protein
MVEAFQYLEYLVIMDIGRIIETRKLFRNINPSISVAPESGIRIAPGRLRASLKTRG